MKTVIATIAAAFFALNVAAHNPGIDPANYCVKSMNGKMVVEKNGSAITKEIKFKDGTCLQPDGTVLMTNGQKLMLKEGECVNETSVLNLDKHRNENWHKKGLNHAGESEVKYHGTKDHNSFDKSAVNDHSTKHQKSSVDKTKSEKKTESGFDNDPQK